MTRRGGVSANGTPPLLRSDSHFDSHACAALTAKRLRGAQQRVHAVGDLTSPFVIQVPVKVRGQGKL